MRTLGRREFVAGGSLSQPFGLPAPSEREPFERSDIMYTYEYERIYAKGYIRLRIEDHEEVITRRAGEGWRYVGFVPIAQSGEGLILEMDLVFEKELP